MAELIQTFPEQVTGISDEKQAIVLVLLAHRTDGDGNAVALTASQKEAARNAAQSALEITPGTEVFGTSTALLLPNVELAEGETLTLTIDAAVIKNDAPATEQEQETAE